MATRVSQATQPDDDRPPEPPRPPRRSVEREGCRRGPAVADEGIGGIVGPVRAKAPRSSSPTPATRLPREERKERSMTPRQGPSERGMQSRALVNSLDFSAASSTKRSQTAHDAPAPPAPLPVTLTPADSASAAASRTRGGADVASAAADPPSPASAFLASALAAAAAEPRSKLRGAHVPDALIGVTSTASSALRATVPAMASRRRAAVDIADSIPALQNSASASASRSRAGASAPSAVLAASQPATTHAFTPAAASRNRNSPNESERAAAPSMSAAAAFASRPAAAADNQHSSNVSSVVGAPLEPPACIAPMLTPASRSRHHSDVQVPSLSPLKPTSATRSTDLGKKSPSIKNIAVDRLAEARSANDASSPKPATKVSRGAPASGKAAKAGSHQSLALSKNSCRRERLRYPAGDESPLPLPPTGVERAPRTAYLDSAKTRQSEDIEAAKAAELAAARLAPAGLTMPSWPAVPASLRASPQPSARSMTNGGVDVVTVPAPMPVTPYMPLHTRSCSADFLGASLASAPGAPAPLTGRSNSLEAATKWNLHSGAPAPLPVMGLMNFWQRPGTPSTAVPGSMFAGELSARSVLTARSISPRMLSTHGRVTSAPLVRDASLGFMSSPLRNASWISVPESHWPVDSSVRAPAGSLSHSMSPRPFHSPLPSMLGAPPQQLLPGLGLRFLESQLSSRQASPCPSHRSLSMDAAFQTDGLYAPVVNTPMRGRRNIYSEPAGDASVVPASVAAAATSSLLHVNSCSASAPAWMSPLPSYRGISSRPGLSLFGNQSPTISRFHSPTVTPRRLGSLDQPAFGAASAVCGSTNKASAGIRSRPASIDGLPPSVSLLPARGKRLFSDRLLSGEAARLAASIALD
eukprot:TRINITY_DN2581_c6_g1_i1.p1 TRINITY_DN2581_c6_g1~~TRINITY_DN2581_c6_g1_i1.p1  ORF type:complete len:871 (+),score=108.17 TRINITY_DN2581_c6_g1_i1:132-2744(+)